MQTPDSLSNTTLPPDVVTTAADAPLGIVAILENQFYQLLEVIPALIKAAVIFLVGYILAKIVRTIVLRLLAAVGVDRLADRLLKIEIFQKSNVDIVPSRVVSGALYYFILIIFGMAAVEAMGLQIISDLLKDLIAYIPNGVTALLVLVIGIIIGDAVKKVVASTCKALGISSANMIANVVFYFILLNIVLIALAQAQLQTEFVENNLTVMLAGVAGAFAIGYGLAARGVMSNLLASFYNRGKIKVGDEVTIDGMRGEVVTLTNVELVLRAEESEYIIPFHKIAETGVEIHSRRSVGPALPPNRESK